MQALEQQWQREYCFAGNQPSPAGPLRLLLLLLMSLLLLKLSLPVMLAPPALPAWVAFLHYQQLPLGWVCGSREWSEKLGGRPAEIHYGRLTG
jgi:hypothetical protein